jgi:MoaA/NifB/PqqE/SkfB family radical SAM enzyme
VESIAKFETLDSDLKALNFVWLEITNRCNLECSHCYAESGPKESSTGSMTFEDWCNVMDESRALGCTGVQFIGGEPTLHPRFLDLVASARQKGFDFVEVYTNATRLSPRICAELKRNDAHVAVSFYSADESVHNRITRRKGSFQRTISGILEAKKHNISLRVGIVATEDDEHTAKTKSFVERLGVDSIRVDRQREVGRSASSRVPPQLMNQLCGACGQGRIAINSRGRVSPCVFSHFRDLGHVSEGISGLLRGQDLRKFNTELRSGLTASCSPSCGPNECGPGDDPSPSCTPNSCDPDMCDPISCAPRD